MWPFLTAVLVAGLLGFHLYWRRRYKRLEELLLIELAKGRQNASLTATPASALHTYQQLFDGMAEGILLVNAKGQIETVNLALRRLLGLTSDVVGRTVADGLQRPDIEAIINRVPAEGEVLGEEIESPGPPHRSLQINASPYAEHAGREKGLIVVFHDVSRIKQLEITRKEFVANVSHELRTPLSLIKGCVETLQDGMRADPEQTRRFLQVIQKHTDRLVYLIEDLLTLSRLESGRDVLNLQTVEVAVVVNRVLEDLHSRAQARKIQMHNLIPKGLQARADADRLEQVFFNLVENAIKYGREEGEVRIGAKEAPTNKLELWVRDNGPGIAPESRERVFERFYRADRARSRDMGGTGLGLAIVKHIVQAHGGEVWISSEVGRGSTFFFMLPGSS